jgi:hypothetical protein
MVKQFVDPAVEKAFDAFPPAVKNKLMQLRRLIYEVASETDGVGPLTETLKWGQPSYLTQMTKSGSTIRLGREKKTDGDFAVYFKCQTSLVPAFKQLYKNKFRFEGNRAILFNIDDKIPIPELSRCIAMALTYHLNKKRNNNGHPGSPCRR